MRKRNEAVRAVDAGTAVSAETALLDRIRVIWESARTQAARSVNTAHVCANWLIGREIVEEEQRGAHRAEYGAELIKRLSIRLKREYGEGFSVSALKYMRSFYQVYPNLLKIRHAARGGSCKCLPNSMLQIGHAVRDQLAEVREGGWDSGQLHFRLSWMHYRTLLRVEREDVRSFYEIEAIRNGWSGRQFASRYQTHLPSEDELRTELKRELNRLALPEGKSS